MRGSDKDLVKQGRPFILGVVALLLRLRDTTSEAVDCDEYFAQADEFVTEFERRMDS